jgi:hypothetical protein
VNPKRRRHIKPEVCGFCGVEIEARESRVNDGACWVCARNRADKIAAEFHRPEDDEEDGE